jgi:hypothetical protein
MFTFNKNFKRRDEIIFKDSRPNYAGGIIRVELTEYQLDQLFEEKFIDPKGTQNYSPSNKEIYDFIRKSPIPFKALAYTVSPEREDYRVSLEGVTFTAKGYTEIYTKADLIHFFDTFKYADELKITEDILYAWYD